MPPLVESARRGGRVAVAAAGYGLGAVLAGVSWVRGGKAVHPHGAVYRARLVIEGVPWAPRASELLSRPAEWNAVMRFSRSLGLPRPIPDLLGVSLRVIDAYGPGRHQDVLMVSSVDLPVLHHLFVPATDAQQRPYSSSLRYRAGADTFLVGVVAERDSPRPAGTDELDRLARAAATGRLAFGLAVAPVSGRFRRVGVLHVEEQLPPSVDALRFDPSNCGGGLERVGLLHRLRDYAYPLSQAAWARRGGRGDLQREAEAALRRSIAGP